MAEWRIKLSLGRDLHKAVNYKQFCIKAHYLFATVVFWVQILESENILCEPEMFEQFCWVMT